MYVEQKFRFIGLLSLLKLNFLFDLAVAYTTELYCFRNKEVVLPWEVRKEEKQICWGLGFFFFPLFFCLICNRNFPLWSSRVKRAVLH